MPRYLEDRIALHEGRPQRFGSQWVDSPEDGRIRPWQLADPGRVNELRASVGLPALQPIPDPGPPLPAEQRKELEETRAWWEQWLAGKGWRSADFAVDCRRKILLSVLPINSIEWRTLEPS